MIPRTTALLTPIRTKKCGKANFSSVIEYAMKVRGIHCKSLTLLSRDDIDEYLVLKKCKVRIFTLYQNEYSEDLGIKNFPLNMYGAGTPKNPNTVYTYMINLLFTENYALEIIVSTSSHVSDIEQLHIDRGDQMFQYKHTVFSEKRILLEQEQEQEQEQSQKIQMQMQIQMQKQNDENKNEKEKNIVENEILKKRLKECNDEKSDLIKSFNALQKQYDLLQ